MPCLRELQSAFARALIERNDSQGVADWIVSTSALDARARIEVYRNTIFSNYRSTLRAVYPVIRALVGDAFFDHACDAYTLQHPSRSGDLNDFGGEFGAFLTDWPSAAQLAYLGDVARLEWAVECVFHCADAERLDLHALALVPDRELPSLRFELHPASRIVCSPYPILRIWQVNQPGFADDQAVQLDAGGDALLVIRRLDCVELERLSAGELSLLQALASHETLARAHAQALEADASLDLGALLQHHVLSGSLIAFWSDKEVRA